MKIFYKNPSIVLVLAIVFVLGLVGPMTASAVAIAPDLGEAEDFSVLAKPTMTAANPTTISGFLGLSTGLAVVGTWLPVGHTEYLGPLTLAASAKADALTAFGLLAGQESNGALGAWGGATSKLPGVYAAAEDTTFTGTLTLTGDYDDVWIFQIGNDMTFSGDVIMGDNAQPCNVFWQVGNSATIASGSHFKGTLIAGRDITVVSGATVDGRVLALGNVDGAEVDGGALTTDNNTITGPTCDLAPAPASITVLKTVVNDSGSGDNVYGDFPLFVDGEAVDHGASNVFSAPATHTVSETYDATVYDQTFSSACPGGVVTLAPGDDKVCTITNDDIAAPTPTPTPTPTDTSSGSRSSGYIQSRVPPIIDVVKVPNPLALPAGPGLVTYTYTLHNNGTVPVTNITMVDDSCSTTTLISGDTKY